MAAGSEGNILVVIHGAGRGRSVPTGDVFFSRLKVRDPELAARLRFHQTGTPAPGLNGVALVVFWLGDPLRQKYPDCYADASAIAQPATPVPDVSEVAVVVQRAILPLESNTGSPRLATQVAASGQIRYCPCPKP